jgi:hypothetical protein
MKRLFFLSLLLARSASAAVITFAWDPAPEATCQGYALYGVSSAGVTNKLLTIAGRLTTNAVATVTNDQWTFYITANDGVAESGPSNVLLANVNPAPAPAVSYPTLAWVNGGGGYKTVFTWSAVPAPYYASNYICRLTKDSASPPTVTTYNVGTNLTLSVSLSAGTYTLSVAAQNFAGEGVAGLRTLVLIGSPTNLKIKLSEAATRSSRLLDAPRLQIARRGDEIELDWADPAGCFAPEALGEDGVWRPAGRRFKISGSSFGLFRLACR